MTESWNGLGVGLANLWRLADADSRSITPENPTGERAMGGRATNGSGAYASSKMGVGWKVSPSIQIQPGTEHVLADITGSGAIQHMWMTPVAGWRDQILRIYWDNQPNPAVECPIGDFFASGWEQYAPITSLAICVNPRSGLNSYWEMPFGSGARITLENQGHRPRTLYYQIDYSLCDVPDDAARFCAQWRRVNPMPDGQEYTIVDGIEGRGQYVGTSCAWGALGTGWWGEGEVKFSIDDDLDIAPAFPTICGTGIEDYFGGSYNFEIEKAYVPFSGPYSGMPLVHQPPGRSDSQFSMYRWHLTDPIRFRNRLKVTMQALGWGSDHRYRHLRDDISTVAFWYQTLPIAPFPALPDRAARQIR